MASVPKQHVPRVRVITPRPDHTGATPSVLQRVTVDGQEWAVTQVVVDSGQGSGGVQTVTLTFLADVTIEHPVPR